MFPEKLLALLKKITTLMEQELELIKKHQLKEASEVAKERQQLVDIYQSCGRELSKNAELRRELYNSPEAEEIKATLKQLDTLAHQANRRLNRVMKTSERFVELIQQNTMNSLPFVKKYSSQGRIQYAELRNWNSTSPPSLTFRGGV